MPELPEVEQVKRTLSPHVVGKKIIAVDVRLPRLIQYPAADVFVDKLVGKTVEGIERKGKYLRLNLGRDLYLLIHLRLTGALLAVKKVASEPLYAKIKFALAGDEDLWFTDIRTFGTLYLIDHGDKVIEGYAGLGPEPLSEELTAEYLTPIISRKSAAIKGVILDQKVIAGLGNIYADEALFVAGILPDRNADLVTVEECEKLIAAINQVIAQGIKNHGTTFRDYKDGNGNQGSNQKYLLAYGRKGKPCKTCGTILEGSKVAGRGTTFCSHCQH